MTHRKLRKAMTAYRIGDPRGSYPIFSAAGSLRRLGRWHRKGQAVIYAAEHYSTALLERLVHYSGGLPAGQHYVEIEIPAGTSYEVVTTESCPGWYRKNGREARAVGSAWIEERRSAILIVPSVIARIEKNIVINPAHPQATGITAGLEKPVTWDRRLFDKR
ncbi:MAG: RES domain-containing protein [Alphaproteobacteria bacterium]|nr:RES domain-containing protein [Alphaproteobacteria bacterium]